MTEQSYTDAEFEALLKNYDYSFQKGDLVKGIVCSYDSTGVIVDIGAKTAAFVPIKEAVVDKTVPVEETFSDLDDKVFYEVTMSSDGAYLVTGNIKHFPVKANVITPSQMVDILNVKS